VIVDTPYGRHEVRFAEFGDGHPVAREGLPAYTGRFVTTETAAGLPAVSGAIVRLAELVAALPIIVYRGRGGRRQRADTSWQWQLLHEAPNGEQSAFDFVYDIVAAVESCGNAFAEKVKVRGRVTALVPIDPTYVRVFRDRATRTKRFQVTTPAGQIELGPADVLHFRGPTIQGGLVGHSPIALHRHAFGNAVAMEEFVGRFFGQNARPGVILKAPQGMTAEKAAEWRERWDEVHARPENAHRTGVIGGGIELEQLPVSLEDQQFVEGMKYGVADVARIYRIPKSLLEEGEMGDTAQEVERVTKFSLLPRFRRIERAMAADPDLFGTPDPYPEFLADALLRPDTVTRYRALKDARQGSWITANEVRDIENLPPVAGGDEILVTPVGGAPNPDNRASANGHDRRGLVLAET
jgi:HK97 family phage portal protein